MFNKRRFVVILTSIALFISALSITYAYDCSHYWITDYSQGCCKCLYCGNTKSHNLIDIGRIPGNCISGDTIDKKCLDCGAYTSVTLPVSAPHQWSETLWWDMHDNDHYIYGRYCTVCDSFKRVPLTVKKGKTKQIIPKKFLKKSKKTHVSYNKKKVKAMKNGKVKGKKRGSVATVKWDVKYRNHRGYVWWELYEADIRVK